jgi:sterol desaturase/sphingolipid hydroxylase (fatty acid hydroxylase superfamily)
MKRQSDPAASNSNNVAFKALTSPDADQTRFRRLRLSDGRTARVLRYGLFPTAIALVVGGGLSSFYFFEIENVMYLIGFGLMPVFFLLERLLPWSEGWIGSRHDVHVDIALFVTRLATSPLVSVATVWVTAFLAGWLSAKTGSAIWPDQWNLLAQAVLALVVGDFFNYWVHRAYHEHPLLWRLHATHHSATRLYFFNAFRNHPLDTGISEFIAGTVFVLLGAPFEALAARAVARTVLAYFQHCNLDVELGFLEYIFCAPKNHRWHHAIDPAEGNHNYGNDIMLWDHVFGTFYLPKDREPSTEIGLQNMPDFPRGFWGLVLSPFLWSRYVRTTELNRPEYSQEQAN